MPSSLRRGGVDPAIANAAESGVELGVQIAKNHAAETAATERQQFQDEQQTKRYELQLNNALQLKALEYKNSAEKIATQDKKTFNKDYYTNTVKTHIENLRDKHPYRPADFLKPENLWKLDPKSREQAQAYLYEVSQIEEAALKAMPQGWDEFVDPATLAAPDGKPLLRTPTNYLWTPKFSDEYLTSIKNKNEDDRLGIEIKKLELEKKGRDATKVVLDGGAEDRLKKFNDIHGNFTNEYGQYNSIVSGLEGLYKQHGGFEGQDWVKNAVDKGMEVYDEAGKPIKQVSYLLNKQQTQRIKSSGAAAEYMSYLRDPAVMSSYFNDEALGKQVSAFIDKSVSPKFNNLQTVDDIRAATYWLDARARGIPKYKNTMTGEEFAAPPLESVEQKHVASEAYKLLTNTELYKQ